MRRAPKVTAMAMDGYGRLHPATEGYGSVTAGYAATGAGAAAIIRRPAPPKGWTASTSTNQTSSTSTNNATTRGSD